MLTRRSFVASAAAAVPAAFSELKSRRTEAKPITAAERQGRIARAQQLMAEHKMNAVYLAGGTSLTYFSGVRWWLSERLFAMMIPKSGEPFFVAPAFEEDRAREQITAGYGAKNPTVYTWHEDQSPYSLVATALKDRGLLTGSIGVEETVRFVFADGLAKAAPSAALVSATPITAGCRTVKSPAELALMQLANNVTLQAFAAAWKSVREGTSKEEFGASIASAHRALGFDGDALVLVGPYTAMPHGSVQPQEIREGSIVVIDGGCDVDGYKSDVTRTMVLGKPTGAMKKAFDIVHRAQSAALAATRPGNACEAVDAAARNIITAAGYAPDYKYFTHRVGHGIGMDGHEWPYLVRGNKLAIMPGMTFSDEPGIYIRNEFGVRLEDCMYVTTDGAKLFTPQSASLEHPFG
jgi:Xaa-Pro dipeptidase